MIFYIFLYLWLIFIFINVKRANNSLLSRFSNPNEYVPRDTSKYFFPEDLDDSQYADLLLEVPELAGKLKFHKNKDMEGNTMLPFIRKEGNGRFEIIPNDEEFATERDEDQEEYPGQLEYITATQGPKNYTPSTRRLPFLTRWPLNSSDEWAKRQNIKPERSFFDPNNESLLHKFYERVGTCYWCGMNHSTSIPATPLCHDAFESPDWRARTLARYFRAHCYKNKTDHVRRTDEFESIRPYDHNELGIFDSDDGLVRRKYGSYIGGCFKRFLDVGKVYTQRGCRSWWPKKSKTKNFSSHRFTRLESLIRHESNYCIMSPHASLTPFSRSISLYVRYHVCVCSGRYCNNTIKIQYSLTLITVMFISILLSF